MNITFPHTFFPGLGLDNVVNNIGGLKVADPTGLCHFLANLQMLIEILLHKDKILYYIILHLLPNTFIT